MQIKSIAMIPLLLAAKAYAGVDIALYQDNDCGLPIPGTGQTYVQSGTCNDHLGTGWMSARILRTDSPAGTLTFYSPGGCHGTNKGFSAQNFDCLRNFGFVANAAGLVG
ncbi:hypothetical protein QBC34DRAFT_383961 [Podospora aff. communis PSN243]|uniref:Ecp2 effector protein domain-containing protein n=1 Tax=Podospora aff. communis PSN243 TaxID=3040156 RepID=A0AAV9GCL4_9PEZI|nr:hypothetical protein QBC34DRAFT_383961 [Podospora aff. communis PSN243]